MRLLCRLIFELVDELSVRFRKAFGELNLGAPAQLLARVLGIHATSLQLARPQQCKLRLDGRSSGPPQSLEDRTDVGLGTARDIEDAGPSTSSKHRCDDVGDVHVIASRRSMSEQRRRLAAPKQVAKDRHHAGFTMGALPWAVDVAQAANGVGRAIRVRPRKDVRLACPLRGSVGSDRRRDSVFARGDRRIISVKCPTRGREDHRSAMPLRRLEHVHRSLNVHGAVAIGICDGDRNARLRGEMVDRRRARRVDHGVERRTVRDVDLLEDALRCNALSETGRKIVDHDRPGSVRDEGVDNVGTDEAGPTSDNRRLPLHASLTRVRPSRPRPDAPTGVMILAAGRGTRLGMIGEETPKILLDIGGEPLLSRHLRYLEREGVRRVVVNAHHLAEQVQRFVNAYRGPIELTVLVESTLLGTAGAVRNALPELGPGPLVVLYGDVLIEEPLEPLVDAHIRAGAAVTLTVYQSTATSGKGVVETDGEGRVLRFAEKRQDGPGLVNAGLYVLERRLVAALPSGIPLDFGHDVLPTAVAQDEVVCTYRLPDEVIDIGTPEALSLAQKVPVPLGTRHADSSAITGDLS
jgi:dTDP-glucose pyrophosphorylase